MLYMAYFVHDDGLYGNVEAIRIEGGSGKG